MFRAMVLVSMVYMLASCSNEDVIREYQQRIEYASTHTDFDAAEEQFGREYGYQRFGRHHTWMMELNSYALHTYDFHENIRLLQETEFEDPDSVSTIYENIVHDLNVGRFTPQLMGATGEGIRDLVQKAKQRIAAKNFRLIQEGCPSEEVFDRFIRSVEQEDGTLAPYAGITKQELDARIESCFAEEKTQTESPKGTRSVFLFISY